MKMRFFSPLRLSGIGRMLALCLMLLAGSLARPASAEADTRYGTQTSTMYEVCYNDAYPVAREHASKLTEPQAFRAELSALIEKGAFRYDRHILYPLLGIFLLLGVWLGRRISGRMRRLGVLKHQRAFALTVALLILGACGPIMKPIQDCQEGTRQGQIDGTNAGVAAGTAAGVERAQEAAQKLNLSTPRVFVAPAAFALAAGALIVAVVQGLVLLLIGFGRLTALPLVKALLPGVESVAAFGPWAAIVTAARQRQKDEEDWVLAQAMQDAGLA